MPSQDQIEAQRERKARERGKALPHYARKVTEALARKARGSKLTPSKRG